MKRFWGFVLKEFIHIFRDYRTMLVLFGIPVAEVLIFGYVITNEIKDARIAIFDQSKDEITREITENILSSDFFILEATIQRREEIEECFKKGRIREVIVFEADFARKLQRDKSASIQLIADASNANTANLIVNYTSAIIQDYQRKASEQQDKPLQIVPTSRMFYNEELKGAYMFVPGTIALILILVSAMMTSVSIVREKEFGTMEVLLVSPLKPLQIILGKVTPYVVLSVINVLIILFLGYFVFEVPVKGSFALLLGVNVLYIILALALGILISTAVNTQQLAMFVSAFALMLPTMLLSGFIFPIENMPRILQWLSIFMPARWFITAIKDIMLKGAGFAYIWKEVAVLSFMTVVFLFASIRKFRIRLE